MPAFEDFRGQSAHLAQLESDFSRRTFVHAYLFAGPRGTGKRSVARLCTMAALCRGEGKRPCGVCGPCRRVLSGTHPDVHVITAPKGKQSIGVDVLRGVLEEVAVRSFEDGTKAILFPEAEKMTPAAQNCLLKTLEEPPAYVVFILATTEPQKLPATILSRCQRFDFRRIAPDQIIARLRVALEEEKIRAEDAALARIARAAEGGMRDAWSIMDMCLGYAQQEEQGLTEELVVRVLGAADREFLFDFADKLISGDAAGALTKIDDMMRMGREVQVFVRDVSAHLRALMLAKVCGEEHTAQLLDVTREDAQAYAAQAGRTSHTRLMRMLDLFLQSETDMKWAAQPRFALETAALRACTPEESLELEALTVRVDELERRLREGIAAAPAAPAVSEPQEPQAARPVPALQNAQEKEGKEEKKEAGPAPDAERVWQEALRRSKQKPQLFGMLRYGRLASSEKGLFTVVYDRATGGAYVRILNMEAKNAEVAQLLTDAAGYPRTFRAAVEGTVAESDKAVLAAQQEAREQAQQNLSKVFETFGRENVRVIDE